MFMIRLSFFLSALVLVLNGLPSTAHAQNNYSQREKSASPAIKAELAKLRQQIKQKGAKFQVGYTSALDRTPKQLYGLIELPKPEQQAAQRKQSAFNARINPIFDRLDRLMNKCRPAAFEPGAHGRQTFSWRDKGYTPPVRNQMSCGACYAFALNTAIESVRAISDGRRPPSPDLSEQWLVSRCFPNMGCGGAALPGIMDRYINWGALTESQLPYLNRRSPCKLQLIRQDLLPVLLSYEELHGGGTLKSIPPVNTIKKWLVEKGPLMAAMWGTNSFEAYTRGVYEQTDYGEAYSGIHGKHVAVIVGWDDQRSAWLVQNSWGTDWGEGGFVWMKYNATSLGVIKIWSVKTPRDCYGTLPVAEILRANRAYAAAAEQILGLKPIAPIPMKTPEAKAKR